MPRARLCRAFPGYCFIVNGELFDILGKSFVNVFAEVDENIDITRMPSHVAYHEALHIKKMSAQLHPKNPLIKFSICCFMGSVSCLGSVTVQNLQKCLNVIVQIKQIRYIMLMK